MHYDTHGSIALSGIKHYDALGETPPDTSFADKDRFRRSYYYFYTLATMEPVLGFTGATARASRGSNGSACTSRWRLFRGPRRLSLARGGMLMTGGSSAGSGTQETTRGVSRASLEASPNA